MRTETPSAEDVATRDECARRRKVGGEEGTETTAVRMLHFGAFEHFRGGARRGGEAARGSEGKWATETS